jgi:branched-subunit amino acid aminotransferase/4-amino-4-deoxychorismate lyase
MTLSTALPDTPCFLNGDFSTLQEAKVSVLDRGFIFGGGIYEVIPAYAGKLFRFEQHMAQLNRSLAELRIANPLTHAQWRDIALKLRRISGTEVLLSSATREFLPITLLDGQPVGNGMPGPVYTKLYTAYHQAKKEPST